ncbi:hypothetical protein RF11_16427 [Thelohanellus kitauei]|uniref:Uncharacterized protein n=1 Tax=Thelohanellus kitauei TaxID=669202 RepID=A0A0C2JAT2_THEKT|nr:hypothetical protein RF11_16427 [Thelohanellus kitauei]
MVNDLFIPASKIETFRVIHIGYVNCHLHILGYNNEGYMEGEANDLEVFKPAPVHFCTDFTSTANATVSTYCRDVLRLGTLLQAVRVVQASHLLSTHPYPQPTRVTLPSRHSFANAGVHLNNSLPEHLSTNNYKLPILYFNVHILNIIFLF